MSEVDRLKAIHKTAFAEEQRYFKLLQSPFLDIDGRRKAKRWHFEAAQAENIAWNELHEAIINNCPAQNICS